MEPFGPRMVQAWGLAAAPGPGSLAAPTLSAVFCPVLSCDVLKSASSMKSTWHRAAQTLARGGSQSEAAKAAGVDVRTVRRWLSDEAQFADAVDESRSEMLATAAGILAAASTVAASRLAEIAEDASPRYALPASRTILEAASRYRADVQLEQRIRSLEIAAGMRGVYE